MFDPPIKWYQSQTIRNALGVIIVQMLSIVSEVTGKAFDIEQVKYAVDNGMPLLFDALTVWFGYRAITGRVKATELIERKK